MKYDFRYVSKKDPRLRMVYADAVNLIREIQDAVRGRFTFQYRPVGSYSRNMVTEDTKSNTGFDLDFDLIINNPDEQYTAKEIKNTLQRAMNQVAKRHGYDFPEDSTRVLTIKCKDRKNARILHSIDFAITNECVDENGCIRRESVRYDKEKNRYIWCEQPSGAYDLPDRMDLLKEEGLWGKLTAYYLKKKNENENPGLHSRQLFSMAVNELLQKSGLICEDEDTYTTDAVRNYRTPDTRSTFWVNGWQ